MPIDDPLRAQVEAWLDLDPDPSTRAELADLLRAASQPEAAAEDELRDRFSGRLAFGTAGLRAALGAGPRRMNRLVVRQAAAGLVRWLGQPGPERPGRGPAVSGEPGPERPGRGPA